MQNARPDLARTNMAQRGATARALTLTITLLFACVVVALIVKAITFHPLCIDACDGSPSGSSGKPFILVLSALAALHAAGWFSLYRSMNRRARDGNGQTSVIRWGRIVMLLPTSVLVLALWAIVTLL